MQLNKYNVKINQSYFKLKQKKVYLNKYKNTAYRPST